MTTSNASEPLPIVTRDGWCNATYACPAGDWAMHTASSDRLTRKRLDERHRPEYDHHRATAHPEESR